MVSAGVMSEAETTSERPRDGAGRGVGTRDRNNPPEDDDEDDARSRAGRGKGGTRARGRETREATTWGRKNARDAPRGDAANVAIAREGCGAVIRSETVAVS